jgi:hypothetical protein
MPEMRVSWCHSALGCWITFVQCHPGFAEPRVPATEATPLEPVTAVLDAFRPHSMVALDEGNHNNLTRQTPAASLAHC